MPLFDASGTGKQGHGADISISGAGSKFTEAVLSPLAGVFSIHLVVTATAGSLNATMLLQGSNIKAPDITSDTDWLDFTDIVPDAITGTDASRGIELNFSGFLWYRMKVTWVSGSGSFQAHTAQKDTK